MTEWSNSVKLDNVKTLPKGLVKKFILINNFIKDNSIDVICFHKETYSLFATIFSILGYNTILVFHGLAWRISKWGFINRSILYILDFFSCFFVKKIVFVSEPDKKYYTKIFPWKKFFYIPNGVFCEEERNSNKDKRRKQAMCYLGRISPEKNILNLIRSANKHKIKLDLYGPFDNRDKVFKNSVLDLIKNSKGIYWKGVVETDKVYHVLSKYNIFINPSFSEGMPVSVLEAAANKCYLVLSDIKAHRKLDFPEVRYVECNDIDLKALNLRNNSVKNFFYVKNKYGLRSMIDKYNKLYTDER